MLEVKNHFAYADGWMNPVRILRAIIFRISAMRFFSSSPKFGGASSEMNFANIYFLSLTVPVFGSKKKKYQYLMVRQVFTLACQASTQVIYKR